MSISNYPCPVCNSTNMWGQRGNEEEEKQGISYRVEYILKDVGSGLSDSRNGLNKLFDLVIGRVINKVVIENKDRLTRYQFNVLNKFFKSYGVEIETIDNKECSDEEELTNDIMMLMAVFSGRLYGRRSAKRRKELKENEDNKNN